MKHIPLTFALTILWASSCWAMSPAFWGAVTCATSAACTTLSADTYNGGATGATFDLANAVRYGFGAKFTASETYTLCGLEFQIKKVGSPAGTLMAAIYSDSSGKPGALISTSTTSYTQADITTSLEWYKFNFAGTSISSGTVYHVVVFNTSLNSSSVFYNVSYASNPGQEITYSSAYSPPDLTSWATMLTNYRMNCKIYKYN